MEAREKLSLEKRIKDQLGRSEACLAAFKEHWHHSERLTEVPPEWERNVRREFHKIDEERKAYEALPQSEKDLRLKEALEAASRHSGFAALSVPEKKPTRGRPL